MGVIKMSELNIKIGDKFIIGVGNYNCDIEKSSDYVEARVIKLSAYDDEDLCKLEMTEYGGPVQIYRKSELTNRVE